MSNSTSPSAAQLYLAAIGEQVMTHRETAGLSLTELAEATGLTAEQIDRFEHGWFDLSLTTLLTIANVLRVPLADLLEVAGTEMGLGTTLGNR